jgi:hypothetical protein
MHSQHKLNCLRISLSGLFNKILVARISKKLKRYQSSTNSSQTHKHRYILKSSWFATQGIYMYVMQWLMVTRLRARKTLTQTSIYVHV